MRWGGVSLASDRGGTRRQLSLRVNFKLKNTCASPRRMCDCLVPRSQAIFSLNLISSPKGEGAEVWMDPSRSAWLRAPAPSAGPRPPAQWGAGCFPEAARPRGRFCSWMSGACPGPELPGRCPWPAGPQRPCPWAGSLPLARLVLSGLHLIPHPVRDQGTFSWLKYWLCAGRWPSVHTL